MTWYENKISPVEWEDILNKLHIKSFKSLNDGYSKIHIKTKSLKLIYKKNNSTKSICNAKYLNKFGIYFINIDGGIEGEISPTILKELILFFKNKFFFFYNQN